MSLAQAAGHVLLHDGGYGVGMKLLLRRLQRECDVSFKRVLLFADSGRDAAAAVDLGCVALNCPMGLDKATWAMGLQLFEERQRQVHLC